MSVTFPWTLCLDREDASSLAPMRLLPGLEVAETESSVWLRGPPGDEHLQRALRALPAAARYERLPDDRLRRIEARIPGERLPPLTWQSLAGWLGIDLPAAALPADPPPPVPLRLVRSTAERTPDLLLTRFEEWMQFALQAAQVRLERLQFAAGAGGRVLVRGQPLPPLPGRRFVIHGSIAVPAGFEWHPAVDVEVVRRRLGVARDELVLWQEDGTFWRLHLEQFVAASRGAVRATAQACAETA